MPSHDTKYDTVRTPKHRRNPQLDSDLARCEHGGLTLRCMDGELRAHFSTIAHARAEARRLTDALPRQLSDNLENSRAFKSKWGFDYWETSKIEAFQRGTGVGTDKRPSRTEPSLADLVSKLSLTPEKQAELCKLLGI